MAVVDGLPAVEAVVAACTALQKPTGQVIIEVTGITAKAIMPIVTSVQGYDIRVRTRDEHNPPHVHVVKRGSDVRVYLDFKGAGPRLWDVTGGRIRDDEITEAVRLVWEHLEDCWRVWNEKNDRLVRLAEKQAAAAARRTAMAKAAPKAAKSRRNRRR